MKGFRGSSDFSKPFCDEIQADEHLHASRFIREELKNARYTGTSQRRYVELIIIVVCCFMALNNFGSSADLK